MLFGSRITKVPGNLLVTGIPSSTSRSSTSTGPLKSTDWKNISTLDNPLAKVMQIRGTEYDWKEGNKNYSGHDIGVIAQDIEKVLPEAVSTKPDGTKGVHYNKLIPLLIEAVKDLSNKIDDIKDK